MNDKKVLNNIQVYIEIDEGMMVRVVRDILKHICDDLPLSFAQEEKDASIVVFRNVHRFLLPFDEGKIYVFFGNHHKLPDNCIATGTAFFDGLTEALQRAKVKFAQ